MGWLQGGRLQVQGGVAGLRGKKAAGQRSDGILHK